MGCLTMINKCKFCGSEKAIADVKTSKINATLFRYTHYVRCKNCHARGPVIKADSLRAKDKDRAIEAWNGGV